MSQTQELPGVVSKNEEEEEDISKPVGFIVMGAINFEVKRGCNKIGRDSQACSIIINSKTVSKIHSVIECEGKDDTFIYDNGSTNRTFLGKKPLKPHCRYKLEHGNSLTFGDVPVKFFLIKGDSSSTIIVQNLENIQHSSDDVHDIETQLNNFPSNIFDVETQLDILSGTNAAGKNKTFLQIPRLKVMPQPRTSSNQTFLNPNKVRATISESLHEKFNNTLITSPLKHHKTIPLPVEAKLFKDRVTSKCSRFHQQVYKVDEIINPDVFSMETQCHMNPTPGVKSDARSNKLVEKEDAPFVENKPNVITSTPTEMRVPEFLIPESENSLKKDTEFSIHQPLQSQSSGKAPIEVLNNQNEDLIINDEKLIQSFEDNFFLGNNEVVIEDVMQKNFEFLHSNHQSQCNNYKATSCETNKENQNGALEMNEEQNTLYNIDNSGLHKPCGQKISTPQKVQSNKALCAANSGSLKESSSADGVSILKSANSFPVDKKSSTSNCKETASPHSQKVNGDDIFRKDNSDEPFESSQSYLEITLEEGFKEPMGSPLPAHLVKELNVEMEAGYNILNNSRETNPRDRPKKDAANAVKETTGSTVPFEMKKLSSAVRSFTDVDNCKVPSSQLSNEVQPDKFNATSPSLLFCSSSPDNSQDFIDTKFFQSQRLKEDFEDNFEIAETISHQDSPKIKSTPVTVTNACVSCIPESSDEDSTLSDLEIIEDSPYLRRMRPVYQPSLVRAVNDPLKQKQMFSFCFDKNDINHIKPVVKDESEDDISSDCSYIFDVVNDTEKVRLKSNSCNNSLHILSSSDSDTSDIIGVTPPGNKFTTIKRDSLRFPSVMESIQKSGNNKSNDSPARQSDTESTDSYGFHSVKIPSPRSLEASLLRIMQKRNGAKVDYGNGAVKAGTPLEIIQYVQAPGSDKNIELPGKPQGTEIETSENCVGKRNRVLDNFGEHIPPKKTRTDFAYEIDLNFWNVDTDSESENPQPKSCETQSHGQSKIDNILEHAEVSSSKDKQKSSEKNQSSLDVKLQHCISLFTRSKSTARYKNIQSGIAIASAENVTNAEMENVLGIKKPADKKRKKICRRSLRFHDVPLKEKKTCNFPTKANEDLSNVSYFGNSCVAVAFTGLDSVNLEQIIEDLGGAKTEDLNSSQVLVTDQVRRTVKFLCAIGLSMPIASPQWLLASKERGKFLNPWNFILKCNESEEKWKFDLSLTLEKSKKKKLLEGFKVFATQNVRPPVCDILYIVECCGGIPLREKPETWTKQTIVLSCLEDKKSWPPWKFRSVKIVHYEFILSGVLQQNLDFKTYKLR